MATQFAFEWRGLESNELFAYSASILRIMCKCAPVPPCLIQPHYPQARFIVGRDRWILGVAVEQKNRGSTIKGIKRFLGERKLTGSAVYGYLLDPPEVDAPNMSTSASGPFLTKSNPSVFNDQSNKTHFHEVRVAIGGGDGGGVGKSFRCKVEKESGEECTNTRPRLESNERFAYDGSGFSTSHYVQCRLVHENFSEKEKKGRRPRHTDRARIERAPASVLGIISLGAAAHPRIRAL
ncbi:hypothetical protein DFH06DRAFT_1386649 [Mycena polygramma]|nr:hypothetical protein DFH06DRAFT_1386649 [Mycena polygramma]